MQKTRLLTGLIPEVGQPQPQFGLAGQYGALKTGVGTSSFTADGSVKEGAASQYGLNLHLSNYVQRIVRISKRDVQRIAAPFRQSETVQELPAACAQAVRKCHRQFLQQGNQNADHRLQRLVW